MMGNEILLSVLEDFGLKNISSIEKFGNGLINYSWKINTDSNSFFLQKLNTEVFPNPEDIATNLQLIGDYLSSKQPDYLFVHPIRTSKGRNFVKTGDKDIFRIFPFINDSHSIDVAETADQAYEAARQFGMFTKKLADFPAERLTSTLPEFHNLIHRYSQFRQALRGATKDRLRSANELVQRIYEHVDIISTYEKNQSATALPTRVMHHDTKINNVLFNTNEKGICVVDMDTVMPGYFISDFGDMMRTYLSPSSEDDEDFEKIGIRNEFFQGIAEGYLEQMSSVLNNNEKEMLIYSGFFMTYMQGVRFLTDYLNNDAYYKTSYEGHNLVRAENQMTLLRRLVGKKNELKRLVG